MEPTGATPRIFISYSHDDEAWKDRVVSQLGVLEHEGLLSVWEDRQIAAGDNWLPEIEAAIQSCSVALLLISAKFLTSKFILGAEVPRLLQRREHEGVRVIPVILKPCPWTRVGWLKSIQARPKDGKPLSGMSEYDADAALAALAEEIADRLARSRRTTTNTKVLEPTHIPSAQSSATSGALKIWREKLNFLREQEAIAADPAQKFALKKQIEEAESKIRALGGAP